MSLYKVYQRKYEKFQHDLDELLENGDIVGFRASLDMLQEAVADIDAHAVLRNSVFHKREFETLLLEYQNVDLKLRLDEERTKRKEAQRKLNAVLELVKSNSPELYKTIYIKE